MRIASPDDPDRSSCEVEFDESYFCATRVKGKRGRGAFGKIQVFGLFKQAAIYQSMSLHRWTEKS